MADHHQESNLLGPPELQDKPAPEPPSPTGDSFMDLMLANFNRQNLAGRLEKGFTINNSPTYLTSGDPCLDFFYHILPNTKPKSLTEKLRLAWDHNPRTALKLVCNLRGVRGTGKADRESFFTAALWLHRKHPRTLASNVASFAEFGCFKDLPEILLRLLEGPNVRRKQKADWLVQKGNKRSSNCTNLRRRRRVRTTVPREIRVSQAEEISQREKRYARELRVEKRTEMAKKVTERYAKNWDFRLLYDKISDCFAEFLKKDIESLNSQEYNTISLAAKWCPSLDSSFDRSTLLCESIARKMFPKQLYEDGIEEGHYAYRVRDRLRKEVLVPLRKALNLPEVLMGANQWGEIKYNRVPSKAMKLLKDKFLSHDGERFMKYLTDTNTKISSRALLPSDMVESLTDRVDHGRVNELQWKNSINSKKKKLKNCLAVCDVSRNMKGKAMEVCLSLGLVVSEMSEEPWRGKIITFSDNPKLHVVEGRDLKTKLESLKKKEFGDTKKKDIQKVFDLILEVAENGNLSEADMIKRVFVFSDMEFNRASGSDWATNYDVISSKFVERGYGSAVPEIVFWKVKNSTATPVAGGQRGVALVGGYSKNLMRLFSDNENINVPGGVMELAISGDEYQGLVIVD